MKKITFLLFAVLAFSFNSYAQPANDLCAGATPITPSAAGTGCGVFTFTAPVATDGTTDSGVPTVCSTPGNDIWFTWTATSAGLIWNDGTGNPGIAIFANCTDAAAGTQITCEGTFAAADAELSGWTIGDDLIIQVYDFGGSSSDLSFCLEEFTPPPPPTNDNCSSVIDLGGETSPLTSTTVGALNDFGQDCLTNVGAPDIIYSILVPNGSTLTIGQTVNGYDSKHRLAYGATCPGDMLIACIDDPDTGDQTWVNTTGVDQTVYWIQSAFATASGTFTLAWDITACAPPTATTNVVEDCGNSQFSIEVDITGLGNATSVGISNDGGVTATTGIMALGVVTVGPFTAGTPVVITINHEQDALCDVDLAAEVDACPPPAPANDECTGAIPVNCGDTAITGATNTGATDSGGNAANDVWYSYTPAGIIDQDVTLNFCASSYDTAVRVFSDCPGTNQVVFNDDDPSCPANQSIATFTASVGTTYYIMVEGWNASSGAFSFDVTCVDNMIPTPGNDLCANAVPLSLATPVTGTTAGATDSTLGGDDDTTCEPFTFKSDVWYTYTTAGQSDVVITTTLTAPSTAASIAVYPNCMQLDVEEIACDVTGPVTITQQAGGTYFVRVWSDGTTARIEGSFDITVDATLSNNDFANGLAFRYYPNPVKGTLFLQAQNDIQNVSVYNMLGQEVLRNTPNNFEENLDMSALQTGAYFVQVTINNATETIRIIKD